MELKNGNIFKTLNQTFFAVNGSEPNLGNICMKNKRWENTCWNHSTFCDPQIQLVKSLETSKKVWEKLTSTYKQTNLATLVTT